MNMDYLLQQDRFHFHKSITLSGGYDVDKNDKEKLALSTLQDIEFVGANGKTKALYELSEYLYYFTQWGIITESEIINLLAFLQNINDDE